MNIAESKLWKEIEDFEVDEDTSDLTFSERLAKENGWTQEFSLRAIKEYKRFMFLICTIDRPLTPSDEVDQVWHLHLLYTRSYWKEFCLNVLKREVHHGPTKGGSVEQQKYTDCYEKTLAFYKDKFETEPPQDLWPPTEARFKRSDYRRVDFKKIWIIKNPFK
jgi:hypothetical protein